MKKFRDLSIELKILIYFFILIMVPFTTLQYIQQQLSTANIEQTLQDNTRQLIAQAEMNVDFYIREMDNLTYIISQDQNVLDFINPDTSPDTNDFHQAKTQIRTLLTTLKVTHPEIAGIMILNYKDQYISNEMFKTSKDPLTSEKWYTKAMEQPSTSLLMSRPIGRNISTYMQYSADEVISIIKPIYHPSTEQYSGMVVIDMTLDTFEKIFNDLTVGTGGFMYIADQDSNVIYTPINPITYRIKSELFPKNNKDPLIINIENHTYQIMYSYSEQTFWKTIGVFNIDDIFKEVKTFRSYMLIIAAMTLILAFIFTLFVNVSITQPLIHLKNKMSEVESGNLDVHITSRSHDELGQLGHGFNQMVQEIKSLLNMVEKEHKDKIEAELKVLQAQIKPHFLYNTLDTIRWMAIEHGASDIEAVVKSLTRLFRIGLSRGKELISLDKELQHVESYLHIQKVRYEDDLSYVIKRDDVMTNLKVLKLILQPMVENAIYHGIKEMDEAGVITIRVELKATCLMFYIEDNGVGIDQSSVDTLNTKLKSNSLPHDVGYGIFNVNRRLKLTFGEEYGVTINSTKDVGTVVEIKHPII